IFSLFPAPVGLFWWLLRDVKWADYEVTPVDGKAKAWERSKKMGGLKWIGVLGILGLAGFIWGSVNGLDLSMISRAALKRGWASHSSA
ncbi:hypothetical protein EW146_g8937, partial [Bondarzewia mesenterica]